MKLNQVTFLDDNPDLRELICEYFKMALNIKVLTLSNHQELLQQMPQVLWSDFIILDIELGYNQPSGYDAYKTLLENSYHGTIFFLTGHGADHPLVQKAKTSNCVVWEKPITGEKMVRQIRSYLNNTQPTGTS